LESSTWLVLDFIIVIMHSWYKSLYYIKVFIIKAISKPIIVNFMYQATSACDPSDLMPPKVYQWKFTPPPPQHRPIHSPLKLWHCQCMCVPKINSFKY
jgi:hypothetical protein